MVATVKKILLKQTKKLIWSKETIKAQPFWKSNKNVTANDRLLQVLGFFLALQ